MPASSLVSKCAFAASSVATAAVVCGPALQAAISAVEPSGATLSCHWVDF